MTWELLGLIAMAALGYPLVSWVIGKFLVAPLAEGAAARLEPLTHDTAVARARRWVPEGVEPDFIGRSAAGEPLVRWTQAGRDIEVSEVRVAAGGYSSFERIRVRASSKRDDRSESEVIPTGTRERERVAAALTRVLDAL